MTVPDETSSMPVHIPLERVTRRKKHDDGTSLVSARCSCGHWGPYDLDAVNALVREHGATEPIACAECGHVTPLNPASPAAWRAPWRRYQPIEGEDGTWRYACADRAACHQRQLAPADEDRDDPLAAVIGGCSTFTVSLDLSGDWARTAHLAEAVANFQHVRATSPRRWDQIGPDDRRVLTALVSAVAAIEEALETAKLYAVLPALKAGATWHDLAAATGDWSADECRADYLARVKSLDWPEEHDDEILKLLYEK